MKLIDPIKIDAPTYSQTPYAGQLVMAIGFSARNQLVSKISVDISNITTTFLDHRLHILMSRGKLLFNVVTKLIFKGCSLPPFSSHSTTKNKLK